MPATQPVTTPAPAEVVERVEGELRHGWWSTTLLTAVPVVVAVLVGYVTVVQVAGGDWLALLFPGMIPLFAGWIGVRWITRTIAVKNAERRMDPAARRQAVYVRGLSGTHRIAAVQHPEGFAVLDPIWRSWTGTVTAVRRLRTHRTWQAVREVLEVDVRHPSGRVATALLTVEAGDVPDVGQRRRVLEDPHHPRAVIDLRRRRGTPPDSPEEE